MAKMTDRELLKYWEKELKRFSKKDDVISQLNQKVCKEQIERVKTKLQNDKPAPKIAPKRSEPKPAQAAVSSIKVGDKITGKKNGAVGIVKEIKHDIIHPARDGAPPHESKPYAVIKWQNAKKNQRQETAASLEYLENLQAKGGISIERPKK